MIEFTNNGEIDIRSISTFGVSVKEGDSPIGFFGTGLKYAIAVLLRTGHQVKIYAGLQVVDFGLSTETVRGESFEFVTMSIDGAEPTSIGFTTQLGKQWALWMAYREIACNAKDEGGYGVYIQATPQPEAGKTKIIITGESFESVFNQGFLYILEDEPAFAIGTTEIRTRSSADFFYRSVRIEQFSKVGLYTYNVNNKMDLTEDRTIKDHYAPRIEILTAVMRSDNESFVRDVLTAESKYFEHDIDFHGWGVSPSPTFLKVIGDCVGDRLTKVNETALKVWKDHTKKAFAPREILLTKVQLLSLNKALDFCGKIGFQIRDAYPIQIVESLGEGCLGLAENQTIFIAEWVFHLGGTKQLASTLIEEYLHLRHGWKDLTRELQSFLFEKLVSIGEELTGEPL
jgi:hypothetical protein